MSRWLCFRALDADLREVFFAEGTGPVNSRTSATTFFLNAFFCLSVKYWPLFAALYKRMPY